MAAEQELIISMSVDLSDLEKNLEDANSLLERFRSDLSEADRRLLESSKKGSSRSIKEIERSAEETKKILEEIHAERIKRLNQANQSSLKEEQAHQRRIRDLETASNNEKLKLLSDNIKRERQALRDKLANIQNHFQRQLDSARGNAQQEERIRNAALNQIAQAHQQHARRVAQIESQRAAETERIRQREIRAAEEAARRQGAANRNAFGFRQSILQAERDLNDLASLRRDFMTNDQNANRRYQDAINLMRRNSIEEVNRGEQRIRRELEENLRRRLQAVRGNLEAERREHEEHQRRLQRLEQTSARERQRVQEQERMGRRGRISGGEIFGDIASGAGVTGVLGKMGPIGMAAAAGIGAVGLAFKKSMDAAGEYQDQLDRVNTLLTEQQAKALPAAGEQLRAAALNTGASLESLTNTMYNVISAAPALANNLGAAATISEKAAKAGIALGAETDKVALAMTNLGNAAGLNLESVQDQDFILDQLANTMKQGVIPSGEVLAANIAKTAPQFALLSNSGQDAVKTISSMTAVLTANGVSVEESQTKMKALANGLIKVGNMSKLAAAGIQGIDPEAKKVTDWSAFIESASGNFEKFAKIVTDTESQSALLTLGKNAGQAFRDMMKTADDAGGTMETMFSKIDTSGKRLSASINDLFISIGQALNLDAVGDSVSGFFADTLGAISNWLKPAEVAFQEAFGNFEKFYGVSGEIGTSADFLRENFINIKDSANLSGSEIDKAFAIAKSQLDNIRQVTPFVADEIEAIINNPEAKTVENVQKLVELLGETEKLTQSMAFAEAAKAGEAGFDDFAEKMDVLNNKFVSVWEQAFTAFGGTSIDIFRATGEEISKTSDEIEKLKSELAAGDVSDSRRIEIHKELRDLSERRTQALAGQIEAEKLLNEKAAQKIDIAVKEAQLHNQIFDAEQERINIRTGLIESMAKEADVTYEQALAEAERNGMMDKINQAIDTQLQKSGQLVQKAEEEKAAKEAELRLRHEMSGIKIDTAAGGDNTLAREKLALVIAESGVKSELVDKIAQEAGLTDLLNATKKDTVAQENAQLVVQQQQLDLRKQQLEASIALLESLISTQSQLGGDTTGMQEQLDQLKQAHTDTSAALDQANQNINDYNIVKQQSVALEGQLNQVREMETGQAMERLALLQQENNLTDAQFLAVSARNGLADEFLAKKLQEIDAQVVSGELSTEEANVLIENLSTQSERQGVLEAMLSAQEAIVERKIDELNTSYENGEISKEEYDTQLSILDAEAEKIDLKIMAGEEQAISNDLLATDEELSDAVNERLEEKIDLQEATVEQKIQALEAIQAEIDAEISVIEAVLNKREALIKAASDGQAAEYQLALQKDETLKVQNAINQAMGMSASLGERARKIEEAKTADLKAQLANFGKMKDKIGTQISQIQRREKIRTQLGVGGKRKTAKKARGGGAGGRARKSAAQAKQKERDKLGRDKQKQDKDALRESQRLQKEQEKQQKDAIKEQEKIAKERAEAEKKALEEKLKQIEKETELAIKNEHARLDEIERRRRLTNELNKIAEDAQKEGRDIVSSIFGRVDQILQKFKPLSLEEQIKRGIIEIELREKDLINRNTTALNDLQEKILQLSAEYAKQRVTIEKRSEQLSRIGAVGGGGGGGGAESELIQEYSLNEQVKSELLKKEEALLKFQKANSEEERKLLGDVLIDTTQMIKKSIEKMDFKVVSLDLNVYAHVKKKIHESTEEKQTRKKTPKPAARRATKTGKKTKISPDAETILAKWLEIVKLWNKAEFDPELTKPEWTDTWNKLNKALKQGQTEFNNIAVTSAETALNAYNEAAKILGLARVSFDNIMPKASGSGGGTGTEIPERERASNRAVLGQGYGTTPTQPQTVKIEGGEEIVQALDKNTEEIRKKAEAEAREKEAKAREEALKTEKELEAERAKEEAERAASARTQALQALGTEYEWIAVVLEKYITGLQEVEKHFNSMEEQATELGIELVFQNANEESKKLLDTMNKLIKDVQFATGMDLSQVLATNEIEGKITQLNKQIAKETDEQTKNIQVQLRDGLLALTGIYKDQIQIAKNAGNVLHKDTQIVLKKTAEGAQNAINQINQFQKDSADKAKADAFTTQEARIKSELNANKKILEERAIALNTLIKLEYAKGEQADKQRVISLKLQKDEIRQAYRLMLKNQTEQVTAAIEQDRERFYQLRNEYQNLLVSVGLQDQLMATKQILANEKGRFEITRMEWDAIKGQLETQGAIKDGVVDISKLNQGQLDVYKNHLTQTKALKDAETAYQTELENRLDILKSGDIANIIKNWDEIGKAIEEAFSSGNVMQGLDAIAGATANIGKGLAEGITDAHNQLQEVTKAFSRGQAEGTKATGDLMQKIGMALLNAPIPGVQFVGAIILLGGAITSMIAGFMGMWERKSENKLQIAEKEAAIQDQIRNLYARQIELMDRLVSLGDTSLDQAEERLYYEIKLFEQQLASNKALREYNDLNNEQLLSLKSQKESESDRLELLKQRGETAKSLGRSEMLSFIGIFDRDWINNLTNFYFGDVEAKVDEILTRIQGDMKSFETDVKNIDFVLDFRASVEQLNREIREELSRKAEYKLQLAVTFDKPFDEIAKQFDDLLKQELSKVFVELAQVSREFDKFLKDMAASGKLVTSSMLKEWLKTADQTQFTDNTRSAIDEWLGAIERISSELFGPQLDLLKAQFEAGMIGLDEYKNKSNELLKSQVALIESQGGNLMQVLEARRKDSEFQQEIIDYNKEILVLQKELGRISDTEYYDQVLKMLKERLKYMQDNHFSELEILKIEVEILNIQKERNDAYGQENEKLKELHKRRQELIFRARTGGATALDRANVAKIEQQIISEMRATNASPEAIRHVMESFAAASYATGTAYVPENQLAMVHQGERILPKLSNEQLLLHLDNLTSGVARLGNMVAAQYLGEKARFASNANTNIGGTYFEPQIVINVAPGADANAAKEAAKIAVSEFKKLHDQLHRNNGSFNR